MKKSEVQDFLIEKGVPTSLKGFGYITDAVVLWNQNSKIGEMYDHLGANFGDTYIRVERAIRHALTHCDLPVRGNANSIAYIKMLLERRSEKDA